MLTARPEMTIPAQSPPGLPLGRTLPRSRVGPGPTGFPVAGQEGHPLGRINALGLHCHQPAQPRHLCCRRNLRVRVPEPLRVLQRLLEAFDIPIFVDVRVVRLIA